jgi:hypothetical protein
MRRPAMRRDRGERPGRESGYGLLALALAGEQDCLAQPGMARDLVLLGSHVEGEAFWTCVVWGRELHRTDFVHVAGPCRC